MGGFDNCILIGISNGGVAAVLIDLYMGFNGFF